MSINSVLISLRFDTSPKTKFAAGSVTASSRGADNDREENGSSHLLCCHPSICRRNPRKLTSAICGGKANAARVVSTATRRDWRNWQTRQRRIPKWPISKTVHLQVQNPIFRNQGSLYDERVKRGSNAACWKDIADLRTPISSTISAP